MKYIQIILFILFIICIGCAPYTIVVDTRNPQVPVIISNVKCQAKFDGKVIEVNAIGGKTKWFTNMTKTAFTASTIVVPGAGLASGFIADDDDEKDD
jgi:hypothetical protein